jgi:hypothetical protein
MRFVIQLATFHAIFASPAVSLFGTFQKPNVVEPTNYLDSVFLTGPGGQVYEFPRALAERHAVSEARARELGHLPIQPYSTVSESEPAGNVPEVGGRHKVPGAGGGGTVANWQFHSTWEFGTYLDHVSGRFAQGIHRHPWGDERGEGASESEFA